MSGRSQVHNELRTYKYHVHNTTHTVYPHNSGYAAAGSGGPGQSSRSIAFSLTTSFLSLSAHIIDLTSSLHMVILATFHYATRMIHFLQLMIMLSTSSYLTQCLLHTVIGMDNISRIPCWLTACWYCAVLLCDLVQ